MPCPSSLPYSTSQPFSTPATPPSPPPQPQLGRPARTAIGWWGTAAARFRSFIQKLTSHPARDRGREVPRAHSRITVEAEGGRSVAWAAAVAGAGSSVALAPPLPSSRPCHHQRVHSSNKQQQHGNQGPTQPPPLSHAAFHLCVCSPGPIAPAHEQCRVGAPAAPPSSPTPQTTPSLAMFLPGASHGHCHGAHAPQ